MQMRYVQDGARVDGVDMSMSGGTMGWMTLLGLLWAALLAALTVLAVVTTIVLYRRYFARENYRNRRSKE